MRIFLSVLSLAILLLMSIWVAETGYPISRMVLNVLTIFTWLLIIWSLITLLPKGHGSICFLYYLCFSVFHVGLVIATTLSAVTDVALVSYISTWFYTETASYAIHLANVGSLSFAIVVLLASRPTDESVQGNAPANDLVMNRLAHIGGFLLVITVLAFCVVIFRTGAYTSYAAYLLVVRNSASVTQLVSWIYVLIGVAAVLVASCYPTESAKKYLLVFAVWGVFAFQLGLRGEVMFPAMVILCLMARQRRFFGATVFLVMLVVFLVAAGIVRNARSEGDYRNIEYVNPFNAVAEMGSSLRSIYETVSWRESGDAFIWGQSYWAPFERQLALVLPGIERLPAREDRRLLNVLIQERAGAFGYSPVAEAYRNFGMAGVVIIMGLFGYLMAWMDRVPPSLRSNVLIGAVLVPIFIHIRNNFGPVPVQVLISVTICYLALAVARVRFRL